MEQVRIRKAAVPQSVFAKILLPFAVPVLITFALLLLVGNHWPRDIAPGSGLKLAGLGASAITALAVWHSAVTRVQAPKARKGAALLCAVTGLMGWPVWCVGVLPSINGAALNSQTTVRMTLERIEVTHASKSRALYHWAWLKAGRDDSVIGSGRYFISNEIYDRLEKTRPGTVKVTVAEGLLGAQIVRGFD